MRDEFLFLLDGLILYIKLIKSCSQEYIINKNILILFLGHLLIIFIFEQVTYKLHALTSFYCSLS